MTGKPYDDRDGYIWLDGEMVEWRDAKLHVLSHGLHYGGSVFEGERVYDGKVFNTPNSYSRFSTAISIVLMIPKISANMIMINVILIVKSI